MKTNLLIFLSFSVLLSCQSSRAPSSVDLEAEDFSKFSTNDVSGKIQFKKRIGKSGRFNPKSCEFSYEKGSEETPDGTQVYPYERFTIGYEGIAGNGDPIYKSFSYVNANLQEKFRALDLDEAFNERSISSLVQSDNLKNAKVSYNFGTGLVPILRFSHREDYDRSKSSYLSPNEQRTVHVTVTLDKFAESETPIPVGMRLIIESKRFSRASNSYRTSSEVVNLKCSNFTKESREF